MRTSRTVRPELEHALASLQLTPRARRAAQRHGIQTVRDFLLFDRRVFVQAQGCSERSWREIESRVTAYLALRSGDSDATRDDARPIAPLLPDAEHARQLADNGIVTVGDFLARPRADAQRIPCLRRNGWIEALEAVVRTRRQPPAAAPLLPTSLRDLKLREAGIIDPLLHELLDLGCATVGHAMTLPAALFKAGSLLGPTAAQTIRDALARVLAPALEAHHAEPDEDVADWPIMRARLFAALDDESRSWFCARVGIAEPGAQSRAIEANASRELSQRRDDAVRSRLQSRAPSLVQRLRRDYLRELDAFEGAVPADRLAPGSSLHAIGKGSGDAMLPLRLLAFCFPTEAYVDGPCVSAIPPRTWHALRQRLRQLTGPRALPLRLEDLAPGLSDVVETPPRGVVLKLVAELPRLEVRIDERLGEVVQKAQPEVARRLERILVERGAPARFLDLVFDYRERFQAANERSLLSRLRKSAQFVQLGKDLWSLAAWHQDELQQLHAERDRVCQAICEGKHKQSIESLFHGDDRSLWLLQGIVRRDPRVRWLGRGEACPASLRRSRVLDQLLHDFRRAAGEVPMSRFVQNQPPERKRLVERLLHHNRLFVFPAEDRIDVLTNYPFNEERLQRLTKLVDEFLARRNGYAPLQAVLEEVNRCDLGGSWLYPTLLGELLRRHGPFETMPGGFVARKSMGLVGWLMRRARTALREANIPLSVGEMLAQRPELAEFADCLAELLDKDPLVATKDGQRYQIG